jgi:hypothetical protein
MATSEEKQETVDVLKGERYYQITVSGYGGEAAYLNISKEAYEFWKPIVEDEGDDQLVRYMVDAESGDLDDMEIIVPPEAMFMQEETDGEVYAYPWYEAPGEFVHQYGASWGNCYVTIDEVEHGDYGAPVKQELISERFDEWVDTIMEETEYEYDLVESDEDFGEEGDYVVQFYSSEKGSFFDGTITTYGDFDPKKLKVIITEYPNGEDIVTSIEYDGEEVDNGGGDTNGKGYSAHLWSNVK